MKQGNRHFLAAFVASCSALIAFSLRILLSLAVIGIGSILLLNNKQRERRQQQ